LSLTKEHVLPQWLKPLVPFEKKTGISGQGLKRQTLPIPPSERVAKAFCHACNTGWMSDLEKAAAPLLAPLISGDRSKRELTPEAQATIAFWGAKTALTCQYVNPPESRYVPPIACREMRAEQRPPHGTRVWIAGHVGDLWSAFYHLEPLRIWTVHQVPEVDEDGRPKINSYTATLGLGHLLIHVLYFANVEIPREKDAFPFAFRVRPIWPDPTPCTWPPGRPLTNAEASHMSGLFPRGDPTLDDLLNQPVSPPDEDA
jgi:hypothetical protein